MSAGKKKKTKKAGAGAEAELLHLRRRDRLLDAAEQVAQIGHCEWDLINHSLQSCSEGYARIFAQAVDEVLAAQSSWEKTIDSVHPEDRETVARSYRGQQQLGAHEIEYRILRHDGEVRYVVETGTVEFDADGRAVAAVGLLQDVTDRRMYQLELEHRDALAQQVEAITDIGHFIYDLNTETYVYLSQGFARIHGVTVDEYMSMVNSREDDVEDVHPDDYDRLIAVYDQHRLDGKEFNVEYRIYRSDGEIRWIREQGTSRRSSTGQIDQSLGVLQDITEQTNTENHLRETRDSLEVMVKSRTRKLAATVKQLEEEIREREKIAAELDFLANHDALTGLPSLRLCKDRLDQSLAEARRNRQTSAVMFLDLDGFKQVNDEHGHDFGDLVLKATAERIKAEIRETDTVARIGGDEFVIILSSLPEVAIAERIAGSLIEQIALPIQIEKVRVAVSVSIGISLYPVNGTTAEALIRSADRAMYRVKNSGKNGFGFAAADDGPK